MPEFLPLPFVATGWAQNGGTKFSQWLTAAGVLTTHQQIFTQHGLRYSISRREERPEVQCEVSWLAAPFLSTPVARTSCIIHLQRNPWHVLQSLVAHDYVFNDQQGLGNRPCPALFLEKEYPVIYKQSSISRMAAEYMILWDELLRHEYAARHVLCHRVEDDINPLLDRMRAVQQSEKWEVLNHPHVRIANVVWVAEPKAGYDLKHDLTPRQVSRIYRISEAWGYE